MEAKEQEALLSLKHLYEGQIEYYTKKLSAISVLLDDHIESPSKHIKREAAIMPIEGRTQSLREFVFEVLQDGKPRTSRELMEQFNKVTGKNKDIKDFSGQLSPIIKSDDRFSVYEILEYPVSHRNWYCLSAWFNEHGHLKQEYINHIKQPK